MWLLSTARAELHFFPDPTQIKYAILSHVWGENEQTFQDIQRLCSLCTPSGNPLKFTSEKIRRCCIFAEQHGFEWVWIDTCCIDKSSSAELSEAINSMFAWYANADVCYAFLDDVDDEEGPHSASNKPSQLSQSNWFSRGWTLQELIAPMYVVFLSRHWRTLGTKHGLADLLEQVTGVDTAVLRHQRSLDDVSIARRMSWASRRHTTRVEDRAYSLMGLFGVHMPTIYGEGTHAFVRLQQEIIKQSSDQSIFAWGRVHPSFTTACQTGSALSNAHGAQAESEALLAPCPSAFSDSANITPLSMEEFTAKFRKRCRVPVFNPTSYGMRTTLPLVSVPNRRSAAAAVLACQNESGSLVLLFLRQRAGHTNTSVVGQYVHQTFEFYRAAFLPVEHDFLLNRAKSAELYIQMWNWSTSRRPELIPFPGMHGSRRIHRPHIFFFPHWVIARIRRYGFQLDRPFEDGLSVEVNPILLYGTGSTVASSSITFTHRTKKMSFSIVLGLGGDPSQRHDTYSFIEHPWVAIDFDGIRIGQRRRLEVRSGSPLESYSSPHPSTRCSSPDSSRSQCPLRFGNPARRIKVEVMKWEEFHAAQKNDSIVHVLNVELKGSSYVMASERFGRDRLLYMQQS
ncbi:heterokaryon incompatibility protein-domain-containing protein [Daedaleopsis nitida]|nr:heterokaryon incompatibility protein-domain-containing protein [Daedaleopsis nitida]